MDNAELNWRERKALTAFDIRETVFIYNLPTFIGRNTMALLVEKGVVEIADPTAGVYSNKYGWRLCSPK